VTGLANPSFLAVTPDYTRVYAISEEAGESAITAFDYDAKEGNLTLLNRQSTLGASSCHVTWTGKNVVACSYSSGSMTVFPLDEEGRLEPGTLVPFEGSGPDSTRQERSHIHSSKLSPDGRFLFVIDLGADYIYRFPVEDGKLTSLEPYKIKVPAGQGPRHFDFSKDGRFLYLITELEGYVIVYDYNGGDLRQIQMIEADPLHARGSADIHFSPDGKFLYASNRLKGDGLAIFSQDPQTGLLQDTGQGIHVPHPVFVTLTPTDHV
jgi:6-phosphogluconolactonase (cycloisomerase 2 family)